MSAVRSSFAFLLLLLASVVAVGGYGAMWLDGLARTPEPAEAIVAPLATDQRVRSALATELESAINQRLPTSIDKIPQLRPQLEKVVSIAIDEALGDPSIAGAWRATINASRVALVDDLDAYRHDASTTPTIWLDLTPFVEVGKNKVLEASNDVVRPYLERLEWPNDVRVALGRPDARVSDVASEALDLSSAWVWFLVAGALLAILGLAVGSRRGRWVAWISVSLLTVAGVVLGRYALGRLSFGSASSLQSAVVGTLGQGTVDSLLAWTAPLPWIGLGAIAVGVVAVCIASMTRPAEPRAGRDLAGHA